MSHRRYRCILGRSGVQHDSHGSLHMNASMPANKGARKFLLERILGVLRTVCAAWLSSCTRQNLVHCITRRFKATSQWRQNQVHIQGGRHWPLPLGMHDVTKEFGFVRRRAGDFATPVFRKRQTENARIMLDYAGFFKKCFFCPFVCFFGLIMLKQIVSRPTHGGNGYKANHSLFHC